MNIKPIALSVCLLSGALTAGCSDMATMSSQVGQVNSPVGVARDFWNLYFVDNGDVTDLVISDSFQRKRIVSRPGGRVQLGKTVEQNNLYFIESLYTDNSLANPIPFYTVVGSTGGEFKVNYNASIGTAFDRTTTDALRNLSNQLTSVAKTFEESVPLNTDAAEFYDSYLIESKVIFEQFGIRHLKEM